MSKQRTGYSVLVRNLLETTTPELVRSVFEKYGEIRDVYLPTDFFTHKPRGFGFVEFYKLESAKSAVKEMDNTTIDGSVVSVTPAQDRRKSPESMRRYNSRNQGSHIPYGKSHEDIPEGRLDRHDWRDRSNYDSHRVRRHENSYYRSPRSLSMDRYDRYNGDRVSRYDLDDRDRGYGHRYRDDRYGGRRRQYDRHENYENKWMGGDNRRFGSSRGDRDRYRRSNRNDDDRWRQPRDEQRERETMNLDNGESNDRQNELT